VLSLTGCPAAVSAWASSLVDLQVHSSGLSGVAAGVRVDQPVQRLKQAGSVSRSRLGPLCWRMRLPRVGGPVEFGGATAYRWAGRRSQPRDPADAAVAQRPGRRPKQQPALLLGQVRRDQREGRGQHLIQVHSVNLLQPLTLARSPSGDPLGACVLPSTNDCRCSCGGREVMIVSGRDAKVVEEGLHVEA
jgi:hypothetical protein